MTIFVLVTDKMNACCSQDADPDEPVIPLSRTEFKSQRKLTDAIYFFFDINPSVISKTSLVTRFFFSDVDGFSCALDCLRFNTENKVDIVHAMLEKDTGLFEKLVPKLRPGNTVTECPVFDFKVRAFAILKADQYFIHKTLVSPEYQEYWDLILSCTASRMYLNRIKGNFHVQVRKAISSKVVVKKYNWKKSLK